MKETKYDFTILGGDPRQVYMANTLLDRNYSVITYGLNSPLFHDSCAFAASLAEAVDSGQIIIIPIPVTKDGINIVSQQAHSDLTIEHLLQSLTPEHKLFGGCLTDSITKHCDNLHLTYLDFMEQEEITLFNTIATAEGTIAEALLASSTNLHGSSCLILGYGRCAVTLAEKLKGLCKQVDVAARSPVALAAANTCAYGNYSLSALGDIIGSYDYIFNTIPSLVLTREILMKTKADTIIIDIASAPGGVDFASANELKRTAKLCLGLPGKYSPKSSATFLTDYLLMYLGKK